MRARVVDANKYPVPYASDMKVGVPRHRDGVQHPSPLAELGPAAVTGLACAVTPGKQGENLGISIDYVPESTKGESI